MFLFFFFFFLAPYVSIGSHAIHYSQFAICVYLYTSFSGLAEVVVQDDVSPR